mgnify:CR=1 FL=1
MVKYKIYKDEASIVIDVAKGKIDDDGTSILKREFINLFNAGEKNITLKVSNNVYCNIYAVELITFIIRQCKQNKCYFNLNTSNNGLLKLIKLTELNELIIINN